MSENSYKNIYYLGPDGSNTQSAAFKFLDTCDIKVQNKIPEKSVKSVLAKFVPDTESVCVLPIENSIEGIVRETIDNIFKIKDESIQIRGEISIPIKHLLLSKSNDIKTIKTVISHPQAIAQCSNFLYKNFKDAEIKEVSSTSYAAQKAAMSDNNELAAIANETSAKLFNLNILSDDLNDEKDNKTRFYIIGRTPFPAIGNGKTSILFSTKNKSGALCEVLKIFAKHEINLTYIDSRPSKKRLGEYLFFIEIEGFKENSKNKIALQEASNYTDYLKILGSYSTYA